MVCKATISHDGRCVLPAVPVELEVEDRAGERWSGVFEASGEALDAWPVEASGQFRLRLSDGREGVFVPVRQCGRDLGTNVVMFQGAGPLGVATDVA